MKKDVAFRLFLVMLIALFVYQFGIKHMLGEDLLNQADKANEWAADKLKSEDGVYDVVVVGEELDGIAAAITAARIGAKTLLISEGKDLGGSVASCYLTDLEAGFGMKGEPLNRGFFEQLNSRLGKNFTVGSYKSLLDKLVKEEENLDIVYNGQIESPVIENNQLVGVHVTSQNNQMEYRGKRFIDCTLDGKLLAKCKVPFFLGSEDLHLKKSFAPVQLNFLVNGVEGLENYSTIDSIRLEIISRLSKYDFRYMNSRIKQLEIINQGNSACIIQGLEIYDIDVQDLKAMDTAYRRAVEEAANFTGFLKEKIAAFKSASFVKAAERFYVREFRHFQGEYVLGINEILNQKDFKDKIALGFQAVDGSKLSAGGGSYIIGKPVQYGIPLGCIIPVGVEQLFMTGSKASYSSLAASSAGAISTSVTTGEAAAVAAVYSIMKGVTPRELNKQRGDESFDEFKMLLRRQGIYLPEFTYENKNKANWSYPAIEELNTLGLLAAGLDNDYSFLREAAQEDLVVLLLNGIYRLDPEKYSLELDARIKKFMGKNKLTKKAAGEILLALHGIAAGGTDPYVKACEKGYINEVMQLKLKDKNVLAMEDVYYLSSYNIKQVTGKEIVE